MILLAQPRYHRYNSNELEYRKNTELNHCVSWNTVKMSKGKDDPTCLWVWVSEVQQRKLFNTHLTSESSRSRSYPWLWLNSSPTLALRLASALHCILSRHERRPWRAGVKAWRWRHILLPGGNPGGILIVSRPHIGKFSAPCVWILDKVARYAGMERGSMRCLQWWSLLCRLCYLSPVWQTHIAHGKGIVPQIIRGVEPSMKMTFSTPNPSPKLRWTESGLQFAGWWRWVAPWGNWMMWSWAESQPGDPTHHVCSCSIAARMWCGDLEAVPAAATVALMAGNCASRPGYKLSRVSRLVCTPIPPKQPG